MAEKADYRPTGAELRAAREGRAMTQDVLSEKSGVSQGSISALETGRSRYGLTRVCSVLGLPVDPTVSGEGDASVRRAPQLRRTRRTAAGSPPDTDHERESRRDALETERLEQRRYDRDAADVLRRVSASPGDVVVRSAAARGAAALYERAEREV